MDGNYDLETRLGDNELNFGGNELNTNYTTRDHKGTPIYHEPLKAYNQSGEPSSKPKNFIDILLVGALLALLWGVAWGVRGDGWWSSQRSHENPSSYSQKYIQS